MLLIEAGASPAPRHRSRALVLVSMLLMVGGLLVALPRAVVPASSGFGSATMPGAMAAEAEQAKKAYADLPLRFEPNRGQADPEVKFLARTGEATFFLTGTELVVGLPGAPVGPVDPLISEAVSGRGRGRSNPWLPAAPGPAEMVRMRLDGGNPAAAVEGVEPLPGVTNYLFGPDPANWQIGLPGYAGVRYVRPYPGIDVSFHQAGSGFEYDFIVSPGADPALVKLAFSGAGRPVVEPNGDLVLPTRSGELRQHRPVLYQGSGADRREIPGGFRLDDDGRVGFWVGSFDRTQPLVIDPIIEYSTYLGGQGIGVAVDPSGSAYVVGRASDVAFPVKNAAQPTIGGGSDAFVTKLTPDGSGLVYSTFLGGALTEEGTGIAVDEAGRAAVTGYTFSNDFPTTAGAAQPTSRLGPRDAFVAQLSADGSALLYSTYLGGSDDELDTAIATNAAGRIFVTGTTSSADFPTQSALQVGCGTDSLCNATTEGFVAEIDPAASGAASLVYSTYLGGSGEDEARGIAVDAAGLPYVTGFTTSPDFPTRSARQSTLSGAGDAFVTKIGSGGSALVYSTYLGGSDWDEGTDVAVDPTGAAHVTGWTESVDFPITPGAFQPTMGGAGGAFVAALAPDGSTLTYSSHLGGEGGAYPVGIALSPSGHAVVVGDANSEFATKDPFLPFNGGIEGFVAEVDPGASGAASLVWASFFGGSGFDLLQGVAVDTSGRFYLVGLTESRDIPTTATASQPVGCPEGVRCRGIGFLARLLPGASPPVVADLAPRNSLPFGGTPVQITGTGFAGATQVTFGGVSAVSFSIDSPTQITAVTPSRADGVVHVVVTGASGLLSYASASSKFILGFGAWQPGAPMEPGRAFHTATVLSGPNCGANCGKVLVAGGSIGFRGTNTAALYDPNTGLWSAAANMSIPRREHTATLLAGPNCGANCGKVLVVGGRFECCAAQTGPSAELYNPETGLWELTGPMNVPGPTLTATQELSRHTATLLDDGRVLVAGGRSPYIKMAEIYDPALNSWSRTGDIPYPVANHVAALLAGPNCGPNCGNVLITAGEVPEPGRPGAPNTNRSALYNPADGTWRETANLGAIRVFTSATLLSGPNCGPNCGKVMVAGGSNNNSLTSIELFDPITESWSLVAVLKLARYFHTATVLQSGKVLLAAGSSVDSPSGLATAEIYDPATNTTALALPLGTARTNHSATLLPDGRVLVAGGTTPPTGRAQTTIAELYHPTPELTGVSPGGGPTAGGTAVLLTGSGFFGTTSVSFGGVPASSFTVDSPTQITAVTPARSLGGTVPVTVVTPVGPSLSSPAGRFVYLGAPGAVTDLAAFAVSPTEVNLVFSAPPANGSDPEPATEYIVKQSTTPIVDQATFDQATTLCGGVCRLTPGRVGSTVTLSVTDLTPGSTYYYALTARSAVSAAGLSNIVRVTTPLLSTAGYRLVASDGGVFAFGDAGFFGSTGAMRLTQPVVGMAATPTEGGYWLVASDGGVFAFGDAGFFGSTGAMRLNQPIVGMAATPTGKGYHLVAADGGVFSFGDAQFFGSTGDLALKLPIVGMTSTPSGRGYRLVAADGGIFSFGDAGFFGSTGELQLTRPVVGMAATPSGNGYWMVAGDGGIFAFGDARFLGSTGDLTLNQPVVGMSATPSGNGYRMVAADGGIFTFGDAAFLGSTGDIRLAEPVVGMSASG